MISIVMPCLDEAQNIISVLEPLQAMRARGHEVILVDGGSRDQTPDLARPLVDLILETTAGRARQMNAGLARARGDIVWFLHADTLAPPDMDCRIMECLEAGGRPWGHCRVRLSGSHPSLRIIETFMNRRSCLTGIATGDQGIFAIRTTLLELGGYDEIPLMEDIALSRRLKKFCGPPLCLSRHLVTSARRWEDHGIWRTVLLMWQLRLAYFLGADPEKLAALYR
ncbi:TIGR04283 family arsenosugar biosynthesis glycosyltransferase [Thiolapillus brandeum]|nr:TIGR04283 family arsenosugar biosynthesis glycosyltransferase [Thiolapillus brandeum]